MTAFCVLGSVFLACAMAFVGSVAMGKSRWSDRLFVTACAALLVWVLNGVVAVVVEVNR
jgi:hypothetical protein